MRIAALVFLENEAEPRRIGHISSLASPIDDQWVGGTERLLIYPHGGPALLDPRPETPALRIDLDPAESKFHRKRNPSLPNHFQCRGKLRCWLVPEAVDFVLQLDLGGNVWKLEIGKATLIDEGEPAEGYEWLSENRLAAYEGQKLEVGRPRVSDLREKEAPLLREVFDLHGSRWGRSGKATVALRFVVHPAVVQNGCSRDPEREPFGLGFELELEDVGLGRLADHLLPETLQDHGISEIEAQDWPAEVRLRQGPPDWPAQGGPAWWGGRRAGRFPPASYAFELEGVPETVATALWNCWVFDRLDHAEALGLGQPRSFLPSLYPHKPEDGAKATGNTWHLAWGVTPQADEPFGLSAGFRGLRPAESGPRRLAFPSLRDHQGAIPCFRAQVRVRGEDAPWCRLEEMFEQPPALRIELDGPLQLAGTLSRSGAFRELPAEARPRPRKLRMGSLDLTLGTGSADGGPSSTSQGEDHGIVRLELDSPSELACHACRSGSLPDRFPIRRIEHHLEIALAGLEPGGQDGHEGPLSPSCDDEYGSGFRQLPKDWRDRERMIECAFRSSRPLVIPAPWHDEALVDGRAEDPSPMILAVREQRDPIRGLRLDLRISKVGSTRGGGIEGDPCDPDLPRDRVLVIDSDPFFAALVAHEPLGGSRDPSRATEIATWSNHGQGAGAWHLHLLSRQGFCLTLPPQGVGETMERYRTLGENGRADFRFGPPARLSMRNTYFEQNFPEAPWNLRRLLTRPGRELPGAELERAQLELLYGLSCLVDLDDQMVRLAEVTTLVGGIPGPLERSPRSSAPRAWLDEQGTQGQQDAYDEHRRRWSRFWAQLTARLAVFEVWDPARLSALRRKEGVSCWIRAPEAFYEGKKGPAPEAPERLKGLPAAELAHPIDTLTPLPVGADPDSRHPPDACDPDDGMLCGGVTWGFESRHVFDATVRPHDGKEWPRSTSAELSDLRLSALGAWGHQMAAFDSGRTAIYGDVAMGRTFAYRIERIGRIGVFWHRAKHVIVYERSVVPSRQFMSDQNPLGGRPVLRKVRELVEILENERSYPDSGGGVPRQVGFIRRMTFATQADEVVRFHVKSAWGTDLAWDRVADPAVPNREVVEESGWKVPIWIQGAEPADVFPRPRIRVTVASVIDGETRDVERYLDNPENLYFFTRTTDGTGDPGAAETNTWPPVPGVDFVDRPRPAIQPDAAFRAGRLQQTQPSDRAVPSGHGVTTFLLEPSTHGADLTVHRPGDPMSGKIRSFTMTRSRRGPDDPSPSSDGEPAAPRGSYDDPVRVVGNAFGKVLELLPKSGELGERQKVVLGEALDSVATEAGKAQKAIRDARNQAGHLKETWDEWTSPEVDLVEKARVASEEALEKELKRWIGNEGGSELEKALKPLVERLLREKAGQAVADEEAIRQLAHDEIERLVADLAVKITLLTPSPLALSSRVLAAARLGIADLNRIVREGKALETQAQASAEQVLEAPDRLERRIRAWSAQIEGVLDSVIEGAEAGRRVALEVQGKLEKVSLPGIGRKILASVRTALLEKAEQARKAADALRELAVRTKAQHDETRQVVFEEKEALKARLEELVLDPLRKASAGLVVFENAVEDLRAEVQAIEKGIERLERAKLKQVEKLGEQLEMAGKEIVDGILDGAIHRLDQVGEAVRDWLSPAQDWIDGIQKVVREEGEKVEEAVAERFEPAVADVENALDQIEQKARDLQNRLDSHADEVRRQLERERDRLLADLEQEYGEELRTLRRLKGKVDAVAEPGLRLVRAFGEPPEVKGLQFDRPETAFLYEELDERVGITPVIGRVAQAAHVARAVGDVLEPLGIDLPVKELGEQLIPEDLKNFQLSDILPDIAGLRLDQLFSGISMPDTGENVKVRHGIDPQTRRAFFHAELDAVIEDRATIFATGPLELAIVSPRFFGKVDAQVDTSGQVQRTVDGELFGDWQMTIGGQLILIIRQTKLEFDESGDLRFRIRPEQVELTETMKFVSDLLQTISPDVDGLTIQIEPTGISSVLMLPLPDMQAGTSGISGLSLGASLVLRWADTDPSGRSGFSIALAFNLAHRERPFALTIFILGGGGYLTVDSKYFPTTGLVATEVRMAITASASLAIALGPISGGVWVYFGMTASYSAGNGAMDIGVIILIVGRVSVLGIASASIHLGLEVAYRDQQLVGKGYVSITIKICWCFTLRVRKSVTYTLGGKKGRGSDRQAYLPVDPILGPRPVARIAQLGDPTSLAVEVDGLERSERAGSPGESFETGIPVPTENEVRERVGRHLGMLI